MQERGVEAYRGACSRSFRQIILAGVFERNRWIGRNEYTHEKCISFDEHRRS